MHESALSTQASKIVGFPTNDHLTPAEEWEGTASSRHSKHQAVTTTAAK